jgi:hypothetical protein
MIGTEARRVDETRAMVTGRAMAGRRSGWVDETQRSAVGNETPLHERLNAAVGEPLLIDRLPLVHVPNGDTDIDGWGTSDFWQCLSQVDMYNELMTDRRKGSRFLQPPMVVYGERPPLGKDNKPSMSYKPNTIYYVGENGGMAVPDFTNMLKATHDEQVAVYGEILRALGLCKAMLGDVGDVSNRRDREVRLMYMPGVTKITNRREERMQYWRRILALLRDVWQAHDKEGYKKRLRDTDLAAMRIDMDDLLPEDVAEQVQTLTTARSGGAFDRVTYTDQVLQTMGIAGDATVIAAASAAEEGAAFGIQGNANGDE